MNLRLTLTTAGFTLIALVTLFTACEDDGTPIVPNNFIVINYDGDNLTAPSLPANTYEAAARFTAGGAPEPDWRHFS